MHGALRRRYVPCDGVLDCRDIRPDQLHVRLQKTRLDFQVSGTLGDRQSALQDARDLMYISLADRYIKHTILRQRGKLTDAINLKFLRFSLFRQLPFYSAAIWAMSNQTAKEKFSY